METAKRTSYPSKQVPAGPAPLASFEDLPSDELESPEDIEPLKHDDLPQTNGDATAKGSATLLSSSTLDSLTVSAQSTPQVEGDFDSSFTLTPVENKAQSASGFRTGSLSSLNKDETTLVKEKKGSVASLGSCEATETEYSQRKSSWTDIFKSHNPNLKGTSEHGASHDMKSKGAGKGRSESLKAELQETKAKEKGKFLSLFKVGKKINKQVDSSRSLITENKSNEEKRVTEKVESEPEKTRSDHVSGKENEQPVPKEQMPQLQNDLDKSNGIGNKPNKPCGEITITRKNFNISEKEYNIFAAQNDEVCEKAINKCEPTPKSVDDRDQESSECELSFETRAAECIKKNEEDAEPEVDFEAENLLPQDSSEMEDDSSCELHPIPVFPSQIPRISRPKKRTDITTIPVERPRSTTPINAAPLEAYIRAASPSADRKGEKIKLSLPGDQFIGHLKSPKKSTAKSWSDFCEEVLHSPRAQKKDEFGSQPGDSFVSSFGTGERELQWDMKSPANQWVTFETKTDSNGKVCLPKDWTDQSEHLTAKTEARSKEENFVKCSCECHSKGCDNVYINASLVSDDVSGIEHGAAQESAKVDIFSDKCQCQCHGKYVHLWSPVGSVGEHDTFCDMKSPDLFSELSPFSEGQTFDP